MDFSTNLKYVITIKDILSKFGNFEKKNKTTENCKTFLKFMNTLETIYRDSDLKTFEILLQIGHHHKDLSNLLYQKQFHLILRSYIGDTHDEKLKIANARRELWNTLDLLLDCMQQNADYYVQKHSIQSFTNQMTLENKLSIIKVKYNDSEIQSNLNLFVSQEDEEIQKLIDSKKNSFYNTFYI
jgi:hypothetical protein